MKVSCPNCKKVLQAPDDWAGRKVKCPGCKRPIALPETGSAANPDVGLDFDSLEALESESPAVIFERKGKPMTLKEAQAAAAAASAVDEGKPKKAKVDPTIRTCPTCAQKFRSEDIYSDVMCRYCGNSVPGVDPTAKAKEAARYTSGMDRVTTNVSFYTGFTSAFAYPIPAMASILMGMGIALAAIAVPMLAVLAFTQSSALNPINERNGPGDSAAWVGIFLTVSFIAEGIYFGSVAYYILIDTIRTTTGGNEQPPNLTWNIINLGAALAGYGALIFLYGVVLIAMMGGIPTGKQDFEALSKPLNLMILALLTFAVPMNVIGLSSSHALDGLNPARVFRSIGRLIGHYIFLFLIVLLYLGMYVGIMYAVMSWAGPAILNAASKGLGVGFLHLIGGIAAWSIVMGVGFYFAYSIGRILGLFSRTYKEAIDFDV